MSDSHDNHDSGHEAPAGRLIEPTGFIKGIMSVWNIFDWPATLWRENVVEKTRRVYPYYHRQYKRVPTVDECNFDDRVCIFEANEQFLRDRKVDKHITQILEKRLRNCHVVEGAYDGLYKCRQIQIQYETAMTNYYIKYGELTKNSTCVDAYMKQKHRLIWQRRNPNVDIVGMGEMEERQKEREKLAKRNIDEIII